MKSSYTKLFTVALLTLIAFGFASAQISGTIAIPSANYPNIKTAVDSLNLYGVNNGGVTFNVAAFHTEVGSEINLFDSTSNASNPIVFQKSGAGTNPLITSGIGTTTNLDGIIKIVGSDYVTFDAIDLVEAGTNVTATTQMEFGYALLNASNTNGPQYCVIKNCIITLNKTNVGSHGIYKNVHPFNSTTLNVVTTLPGTGSYNKFYSNGITNVYFGIKLLGLSTFYNEGNEIGVDGGNTFTNWGGGGTSVFAINANAETHLKIHNNNISGGTSSTTLRGMYVGTLSATADIEVVNNTISGLSNTATGSAFVGIELNSALDTVNVRKNTITGSSYPATAGGTFRGIYYNATGAGSLNIDSNTVSNNTLSSGAGTGALAAIEIGNTTTATPVNVRGNLIYGNLKAGASGSFYGIRCGTGTMSSPVVFAGNQILNNGSAVANTSTFYGYNNLSSSTTEDIYNNTIRGLYNGGAGTMIGIETFTVAGGVKNIYSNLIDSLYTAGTGVGIHGVRTQSGATVRVYKNTIRNLNSAGASGTANGITVPSGTAVHLYNNFISDLRAPASTNATVGAVGLNITGGTTVNAYYNTIRLNAISSGTTFGTSGIFAATGTTTELRNNIVVNLSTPGSVGGFVAAYRRSTTTLTTYSAPSNNNDFYVDPTLGVRRYFYGGSALAADQDSTIAAYKTRVGPRDAASFAENPPFVNAATTPYDLHMNTGIATQTESGGSPVTTPIAIADDYDGVARNVSTPDVGADEFTGIALDLIAPAITYTTLSNTHLTTDRSLPTTITDFSGVQHSAAGEPRVYFKKGAAGSYFSATGIETGPSSIMSGTWTFPISHTTLGGVVLGDTVFYYVAAQDSLGSAGSNPPGTSPTIDPPNATVATPNFYKIVGSISGTVTIGTSPGPANSPMTVGTFPTMKAFFDSVNAVVVTGDITANVIGDLNEGTSSATLNAVTYSGGPWNILIQPSGGSFVDSGANATGLIILNGADKVKFDGLPGKNLRFKNTAAGPVFLLQNDATTDTVTRCVVEGAASSSTSGSVVFGTSVGPVGGVTGNDNNMILDNTIRDRSDAAGVPSNGVYSSGTGAATNGNNNISNNLIFNWTGSGVNISSTGIGNDWSISGNSLYQTASRTTALVPINIGTGASGYSVTYNSIGGAASDRSGSPLTTTSTFSGIVIAPGTASTSYVQNNILSNLNISGAATQTFKGINVTSGNVFITNNTLGGAAAGYDTIRTNYDSDLIEYSGGGTAQIQNNTVGNVAYYNAGGDRLFGLRATGTGAVVNINNNTIRDLKSNGIGTAFSFFPGGIWFAATGAGSKVQDNTVYNIRSISAGASAYTVAGMYVSGVTSDSIQRNKIYDISAAGTGTTTSSSRVWGIYVASGLAKYINNMISLGLNTAGDNRVIGIEDAGSTAGSNKFFYNSVHVDGAATAGSNATYAFYRSSSTPTDSLRNNILSNMRTGATGRHFGIGNASATGWGPGSSNYNLFVTANTDTVGQWVGVGSNLTGWQTASGSGDMNSGSFSSGTGFTNTATGNLHLDLSVSSWASNAGTPIAVTADYDGDARSATPDIGADEVTYPAPAAFALSSPANGAIGEPVSGTLSWASSAGATRYDVYMDGNPIPVAVVSANQPGTSYAYSVPSGSYYWNVVAENPDASTSSSNGPFNFSTVVPPAAPSGLTAVPTGPVPSEGSLPIVDVNASKEEISKIEERIRLSLDAVSGVQLSWTDNAGSGPNTEDSFYVYAKLGSAPAIGGHSSPDFLAAVDSSAGSGGTVNNTHSGLGLNEHWYYKVTAKNAQGESNPASVDTTTFVNAPAAPTFSDVQSKRMTVIINTNGNPETTEEYAIQHVGSGQYVTAGGTISSATAVWQTYAAWGGLLGKNVTGLTRNTLYAFQVKARNGANVESAFGPSGNQSTTADQDVTLQYLSVPNIAILDNVNAFDTISTSAVQINKVRVVIDSLTHSWDSDLDMYIYAPNGDSLELSTDNGSNGDHYFNTTFDDAAGTSITVGVAPFSGSFTPEGVPGLSRFIGSMPAGDWVLRIFDDATGDTGILKRWRLLLDVKAAPDTLIVRKYNDADGNMATSGDRTLKSWYLELWKDSVGTGTLVGSGSTDSLYVTDLIDGTYIAAEADSATWYHIGKVRNGMPVTTSARFDTVVVSGGGVTWVTDFVNSQTPPPVLVTFRVDMRPKMLDGFFEPDTDFVEVRGGFNGWSAGDTLADGDADSIYTKTLALAPNTSYDYKFYKSPRGAYGWEDGISNRNVMTSTADTVLPAPYFNDDDFTVPATFFVNMKIKLIEGTFTPPAQGVFVRGNFNNWSGPVGPMTDGDNDSIYTFTTGIPSGKLLEYKFWTDAGLGWEGVSNRQYNVLSNTPPTLPVWYFDDDSVANIPGFLASPSSIAFGSIEVADTVSDVVVVYNTGLASLNISSITSDNSVFTLTPNSGTLAVGESLLVMVSFIPDSAQAESGTLTFTHDAAGSPGTVTLSGTGYTVVPMYFLSLSPDSVFNEDPLKIGKSKKPVKRHKGLYPNWSNLLDETNAQGGFGPAASESDSAGGMLLGSSFMYSASPATPLTPKWKAQKDSAKLYCWVRLAKWDFKKSIGKSFANIQKTMIDKTIGKHTGPASGFDTTTDGKFKKLVKQQTKLTPKKQNNKLISELIALKVNIAASAMGKTPAGFGDLIFDVDGNQFDEMTVMAISDKADSMMTFWGGYSQTDYDSLHSTLYNINRAFLGALDTIAFNAVDSLFPLGKMILAGQVDINTLSFLKMPPLFVPTRIIALNSEVESPEDFDDDEFDDEEGGTPVAAKLYQNYPNPFNPSTTIAFRLKEVSTVTVKIYNLLGQEIATLIEGEDMDEGLQTLQFSADQLSSGVYFYRIDAQGQDDTSLKTIETRKMVLLK